MIRKYRTHRRTEREAICFAGTRGSQTKIMQDTSRALQPHRNDSTKVARITVPVLLPPGKDPADTVASASYRPLVAVLRGLRSHDERLVEQLASRAHTSGQRKIHVRGDEDGRIIGGEDDGEDQEHDDADAAAESALLHFSTPRGHSEQITVDGETEPVGVRSRGSPRPRPAVRTSSRASGFAVPSGCVPVAGVNRVSPSLSRCTGRTARAPSYAVPTRSPRRRGFPHRTGTATLSSPLPRFGLAPSAVSVTPVATASAATSPAASTAQ
ncbi:hypothetical protein SUDANB126_07144 [Streptomyces sp. enrichment culture]